MSEKKIVFETFREIGSYQISNMTSEHPTCFNGNVNFRKYKVTIEPIEEPNEVLAERIQKMWDECNNHHHVEPLRKAAASIGYELKNRYGTNK